MTIMVVMHYMMVCSFGLSCKDMKLHEATQEVEATANTTTSSIGDNVAPMNSDLEETPVNVDNTINVVS